MKNLEDNETPRQMTLEELDALKELQAALSDELERIITLYNSPNRTITPRQADYYRNFHRTLFGSLEYYGIYGVEYSTQYKRLCENDARDVIVLPRMVTRDSKIKDCNVTQRLKNFCAFAKIETVGRLVDIPRLVLLRLSQCGRITMSEIDKIKKRIW